MGRREAARPGSRRERDVTATITIVHRRVDGALGGRYRRRRRQRPGAEGPPLPLVTQSDCSDPR